MQELVAVKELMIGGEAVNAVGAREFYLGLGLMENKWSRWAEVNIEQNEFFLQDVDFVPLPLMGSGSDGRFAQDYVITLEFAKHIAMMAKTSKSHEYRNYFLDCERKLLAEATKAASVRKEIPSLIDIQNQFYTMLDYDFSLGFTRAEAVERMTRLFNDEYGLDIVKYMKLPDMSPGARATFYTLAAIEEIIDDGNQQSWMIGTLYEMGYIVDKFITRSKKKVAVTKRGEWHSVTWDGDFADIGWSEAVKHELLRVYESRQYDEAVKRFHAHIRELIKIKN